MLFKILLFILELSLLSVLLFALKIAQINIMEKMKQKGAEKKRKKEEQNME